MRNFCLTVYRISLTLWLGAALFFAAVAIKPLRSPEIEALVRPRLALILFPGYYHWGLILLGTALVTGGLARKHPQLSGWRAWTSLLFAAAALACLLADLKWIYGPLEAMMQLTLARQVPAADFRSYHLASMQINAAMASFCLVAAVLACWSGRESPAGESQLPAQIDPSV